MHTRCNICSCRMGKWNLFVFPGG